MAEEQAPGSVGPISIGPLSAGPPSGGFFEVNARANKTIDGLATALRALGLFFLIYGALNVLYALDQLYTKAFVTGARTLIEGALYLGVSRFLQAGSKALAAVVDTRGSDIPNLMSGLDVVRRAIVLWGWAMFGL